MDLKLKSKTAIVAASSTGLGFATALQLAKEGANVMICGRTKETVDSAIAKIRSATENQNSVNGLALDLTDKTMISKLVDETIKLYKGIDIVITNAGGPKTGKFTEMSDDDFKKAYETTFLSAAHLIEQALPHLAKSDSASILTITSISTKQPINGLVLSNIFRPAVVGMTKTLSQELGPKNIRVNSILPGWTSTDRTKELLQSRAGKNRTSENAEMDDIVHGIPLRRFATPEEFANVAVFLVSPAASYVTGMMMQVDGGSYSGLL